MLYIFYKHLFYLELVRQIPSYLKQEEVLKTLEAYGPESWESKKQLGKTSGFIRVSGACVLLQGSIHLLTQDLYIIDAV